MRIQRLDLLRYGRFTDAHLVFTPSISDFHIVFGPNEAGKSTALSAMSDLLFGIAGNSPYNFVHDYGSMRIGAVLQNGAQTLEVRRRKGNKDTLLTADDLPTSGGNSTLVPFLGDCDQAFFERMFSLDHERLRKGGREILDAHDEIGQMLFSAGTGLSGLRSRLKALANEADALWASRKASHRKYYQASDKLEAAERALREHTITAAKWQETKRAYDNAQEAYDALEKEIEGIASEQRRLSRIRRVYRDARRLAALNVEVAALHGVVTLPEDARSRLEAAERDSSSANTRVDTLKEQLAVEQNERKALECDEDLLLRSDDVLELHKRRIEVQKEKNDLPNRRVELATAQETLKRLAEELDWNALDVGQLIARIPPRAKVASVRTLLNARGERISSVTNAIAAVDELDGGIDDLKREIDSRGTPVDVSNLAAIIKATRERGDSGSRIDAAETGIRESNASIQRHLKFLRPQIADEGALSTMEVPPRDTVHHHRDMVRGTEQNLQICRERIRTAEQDLARHLKAQERLARDEDAVTSNDIVDARERRDAGWSLIRRQYVEGLTVPASEIEAFGGTHDDLPREYETSIDAADSLADRRFANAEAAAQIAITSRQIAEQQDLLEALRHEERKLAEENQALEVAWNNLWGSVAFEPLTPDLMLDWLTVRAEILEAVERRAMAERQLSALRSDEAEARKHILAELATLAVEVAPLQNRSLRIVIEAAAALQAHHEADEVHRRQSQDQLRKMKTDADRKRTALETAKAALVEWQAKWAGAVNSLGLNPDAPPEAISAQLDSIERMREIAVEINQLRHERIEKIERDIDSFARDVAILANAVAKELAKIGADDAVIELEKRLESSKKVRERQNGKDSAIASLEKKLTDCEAVAHEAHEVILQLEHTAGVEDIEQLKASIEQSDKLRLLSAERLRAMDTLAKEGDGLSLDELSQECDVADIDHIAAREQTLGQELKDLQARLTEATERRGQSRNALEAIGGDSRASDAAAAKQAALVEVRVAAEQYVRVRSAAMLLQWAIDRYRREKQAPLLKRAGEIFARLTTGSFNDLRVEFDEQDRAQLAGLRPSGELVRVGGMSTGTADQLYLALRIASIDDYLDRALPLPFLADDLFINFDDERAAAGFAVLGELSRKTQVLFFTHHQHLVEIAIATLGKSAGIVSLVEKPFASSDAA
jgi:uncharacterized protein YhaN